MSAAFDADEGDTSALFGSVIAQEEHDTIVEVLEQHADRHEMFRRQRWRKPLGKIVLRNQLRHAYHESATERPFLEWLKSLPWETILEFLIKLAPLVL